MCVCVCVSAPFLYGTSDTDRQKQFDIKAGTLTNVSIAKKFDPKEFLLGDVTCFLIYEMYEKMFCPTPLPLPPQVCTESW